MDKNKAVEVLKKAMGCLQTDPKDCHSNCSQCKNNATTVDGIEALDIAIKALKQPEIILCKNCLYKKLCSFRARGAAFCSFGAKEKGELT